MYQNLRKAIEEIGISENQIISNLDLDTKFINGEYELSFSDAQRIQKNYFSEYSLAYLFDTKKRS